MHSDFFLWVRFSFSGVLCHLRGRLQGCTCPVLARTRMLYKTTYGVPLNFFLFSQLIKGNSPSNRRAGLRVRGQNSRSRCQGNPRLNAVCVPPVTLRIPPLRYLCGLLDCFYGDPTLRCMGSKRQLMLHVHLVHLSQVPCLPGTSSKLGEEAISQRGK